MLKKHGKMEQTHFIQIEDEKSFVIDAVILYNYTDKEAEEEAEKSAEQFKNINPTVYLYRNLNGGLELMTIKTPEK